MFRIEKLLRPGFLVVYLLIFAFILRNDEDFVCGGLAASKTEPPNHRGPNNVAPRAAKSWAKIKPDACVVVAVVAVAVAVAVAGGGGCVSTKIKQHHMDPHPHHHHHHRPLGKEIKIAVRQMAKLSNKKENRKLG